jgi:hypothetical protein
MKRSLLTILLLTFLVVSSGAVQPKKKKAAPKAKPPCAADLASCPNEGCGTAGTFDPELNKAKNITTLSGTPEDKDYSYLAQLPKMPLGYTIGGNRQKLVDQGEGKAIRVVAYALVIRKEGGETCNCKLLGPTNTDNHIVIVSPKLKKPTLAAKEPTSQTAEYTPRVRADNHPNFTFDKLSPLIAAGGGKLLVRVTGQQMFDSEHAKKGHTLKRLNNWEIHPIFDMEYCPKAKKCTAGSDANWVNIAQ